eukprot:TRINITY_DN12115_c0_g1_i2.p1 TRINITY_DN12115_c0_g1~~TRINITY_DN12115_c0_g1_i2.p1  ORF type:complete len:529 (-),score=101.43 TRINITY_DN12115_c0_g1_i2:203-1789(-)
MGTPATDLDDALRVYQEEGPMYIADQPLADQQHPTLFFCPKLAARPFWPSRPDLAELQMARTTILSEFQHLREVHPAREFYSRRVRGSWSRSHLLWAGTWQDEACALCPHSVELLKKLPVCLCGLGDIYFSVLAPGSSASPLQGKSNATLQTQLVLQAPSEGRLCVGEQDQPWGEGGVVLFDNSFVHGLHSGDAGETVVLVLDLWHPGLNEERVSKIKACFPAQQHPDECAELRVSMLTNPSLALEIASELPVESVGLFAQSCGAWRDTARDEDLWQGIAVREFGLCKRHPGESWRDTCKIEALGTFQQPSEGADYDYLLKVLMIGDSGVGKSCHLLRFSEGMFTSSYMTTIGVDFKIRRVRCKDKDVKIQMWDTAGPERFRTITAAYYRGCGAVLVMYDITSRDSFQNCTRWFEDAIKFSPQHVLVGLVGCKLDLESKRMVSTEEAATLAASWEEPLCAHSADSIVGAGPRVCFTETSSRTGQNSELAVAKLVRRWMVDQQAREGLPSSVVLEEAPPSHGRSKCAVC